MTIQQRIDEIKLESIDTQHTQCRAALNPETVASYKELYRDGVELPPLEVVRDGSRYYLWDGHHRLTALREAGYLHAICRIRRGTLRDAILLAAGANAAHGLPRSNEDKRHAVMTLLNDPEWSKKSDRWIAEQCRVSHVFVAKLRASGGNVTTSREGRDGKMYPALDLESLEREVDEGLAQLADGLKTIRDNPLVRKTPGFFAGYVRKRYGVEVEDDSDDALHIIAKQIAFGLTFADT